MEIKIKDIEITFPGIEICPVFISSNDGLPDNKYGLPDGPTM